MSSAQAKVGHRPSILGLIVCTLSLVAVIADSREALAEASKPTLAVPAKAPVSRRQPLFSDVTTELGVDFRHRHFGTGAKYMPENMGAGVAVFDANGDGQLDLYFVQGAPWTNEGTLTTPLAERTNRLFLQRGGKFQQVTGSGLEDGGYGMGVAIGDIDGDSLPDVLVTNFGRNHLFHNLGDGRFRDETPMRLQGGPGNAATLWSTGAAFFDADRDGDLDLYVVNYLDFSLANHKFCGSAARKLRSYCHPDIYNAQPDVYYRNRGDGVFEDQTLRMGFASPAFSAEGKGLGVFAGDLDGNGDPEIYVANDSTRNLLFIREQGRFREGALLAGLGYSGSGRPEASMGIAAGDIDADGRIDLFLTHLDMETNTLYVNRGDGLFVDATASAGLSGPSLPWVGFGTQLFDMDLDGDLDLFVGNGHIIDNISQFDPERSHSQPAQLFENAGDGKFNEVSRLLGLNERRLIARSAVVADWDRDGDLDLVITQNDGPALLLRNDLQGGRSVSLRLSEGGQASRAIGARVRLLPDPTNPRDTQQSSATLVRWNNSTTGYLSQPPRDVVIALPPHIEGYTIEVSWPSGTISRQHFEATNDRTRILRLRPHPQPPSTVDGI